MYITLLYLFVSALRLSAVSWGGFSLMNACRELFVVKHKFLSEEQYADAVALAWIMPGPVASNVAVRLGAMMGGIKGAIAMGLGAALPFIILMSLMAVSYQAFNKHSIEAVIAGFTPAGCAIIMSAATNQAKGLFKGWRDAVLALGALGLFMVLGSQLAPVIVLFIAGIVGTQLYNKSVITYIEQKSEITKISWIVCLIVISGAILVSMLNLSGLAGLIAQLSSVSLTLFGGGLIVIPILHDLLVSKWISSTEFYAAIASAQIVPGPLLSSVVFMGYHISGIVGAWLAFCAIFIPPAALMLVSVAAIKMLGGYRWFINAMQGVRIAVVGLTVAAGLFLAQAIKMHWLSLFIFVGAFYLLQKTKVPVAVIVPLAGFLGYWCFG